MLSYVVIILLYIVYYRQSKSVDLHSKASLVNHELRTYLGESFLTCRQLAILVKVYTQGLLWIYDPNSMLTAKSNMHNFVHKKHGHSQSIAIPTPIPVDLPEVIPPVTAGAKSPPMRKLTAAVSKANLLKGGEINSISKIVSLIGIPGMRQHEFLFNAFSTYRVELVIEFKSKLIDLCNFEVNTVHYHSK